MKLALAIFITLSFLVLSTAHPMEKNIRHNPARKKQTPARLSLPATTTIKKRKSAQLRPASAPEKIISPTLPDDSNGSKEAVPTRRSTSFKKIDERLKIVENSVARLSSLTDNILLRLLEKAQPNVPKQTNLPDLPSALEPEPALIPADGPFDYHFFHDPSNFLMEAASVCEELKTTTVDSTTARLLRADALH